MKLSILILLNILFALIILENQFIRAEKDLYKVLGLSRSATPSQIKKKYRELTIKFHPDRNKAPDAKDKFAEIAGAYEVLSDQKKRRLYDRGGMEAVQQQAARESGGGGHDPFDMFSNLFGGGFKRARENRDEDLKVKIRVTLEDLYVGKEIDVNNIKDNSNSLLIPETLSALIAVEAELRATKMCINVINAKDKA